MSADLVLELLQKPAWRRTAADVRRLQTDAPLFGCCSRFADNQGCDCLVQAVNRDASAVPESQAPKRDPQVNETAVEFLKAELVRVQNERDAALANERQQLRIAAELRQQVGLLLGTLEMAATAANNEEYLQEDGFNAVSEKVAESEARIAEINKTRAVV